MSRFIRITSKYNFIEMLTERAGLRASTGPTDLLELTGRTDLRTSTVHIELQESPDTASCLEVYGFAIVKRTYTMNLSSGSVE